MTDLTNPIYNDPEAARKHLESLLWPHGPFCPHCGEAENIKPLKGKSHRPGLLKCYSCKGHFTVTVGTVFERSKVPLHKWVLAAHLLGSSKKGISAHQVHRTLGVTYKTAWFMLHRLREAMRVSNPSPMGGGGSIAEADETFWGNKKGYKVRSGYHHKEKIFTLVERGGRARSFHVPSVKGATLWPILKEQLKKDTHLMTDDAGQYRGLRRHFQSHGVVAHSIGEYVRGNVHSNTVESYFSILKRGLVGTYQHISAKHLKRYLGEFDFRHNYRIRLGYNDTERAEILLRGIKGKRMTYR